MTLPSNRFKPETSFETKLLNKKTNKQTNKAVFIAQLFILKFVHFIHKSNSLRLGYCISLSTYLDRLHCLTQLTNPPYPFLHSLALPLRILIQMRY